MIVMHIYIVHIQWLSALYNIHERIKKTNYFRKMRRNSLQVYFTNLMTHGFNSQNNVAHNHNIRYQKRFRNLENDLYVSMTLVTVRFFLTWLNMRV